MKYTPEKHYEDEDLNNRVYSEMATGDWWWEVQASAHNQIFIDHQLWLWHQYIRLLNSILSAG